jgi:hypothetical protein
MTMHSWDRRAVGRLVAIVIGFALAVTIDAQRRTDDGRRIYHSLSIDNRAPEGKNPGERAAVVDAVVVATTVGEGQGRAVPVTVPPELIALFPGKVFDPPPAVHTEHSAVVDAVWKASPTIDAAGGWLEFITIGGDAPYRDGRAVGRGPAPLRAGGQYLLFLSRNMAARALVHDHDIFEVVAGLVRAHDGSSTSTEFGRALIGQRTEDVRAAIERALAR